MKKVLVIDSGNPSKEAIEQIKVFMKTENLSLSVPYYDFEINGVKYRKRPEARSAKGHRSICTLAAMTMAMTGMGMPGIGSERKRPTVNIVEEFELIQNKQSTLCRNDRDWVVNQFKYLYEEVK